MSITELRDKYQKKLESLDEIILHPNSAFLSRKDKIKKQKHIEKFISNLNALIQSEDKEGREWISVKDRLPTKEDEMFIGRSKNGFIELLYIGDDDEIMKPYRYDKHDYSTINWHSLLYWMSLPKPPVESEKGSER